ncbi:MAG: hypothetical protein KUG77_12510, partial [Nannocystaceae bacterium]|nr:hypothetical protein [Nannocystaceae bacterium]
MALGATLGLLDLAVVLVQVPGADRLESGAGERLACGVNSGQLGRVAGLGGSGFPDAGWVVRVGTTLENEVQGSGVVRVAPVVLVQDLSRGPERRGLLQNPARDGNLPRAPLGLSPQRGRHRVAD